MSKIKRVRRGGGNEADVAGSHSGSIGTNEEHIKFPFGCESVRLFNGDQIVGDLSLVARQLAAATPDGVALLDSQTSPSGCASINR
jgi:hypothetical protein